jgi:hypothetical protein
MCRAWGTFLMCVLGDRLDFLNLNKGGQQGGRREIRSFHNFSLRLSSTAESLDKSLKKLCWAVSRFGQPGHLDKCPCPCPGCPPFVQVVQVRPSLATTHPALKPSFQWRAEQMLKSIVQQNLVYTLFTIYDLQLTAYSRLPKVILIVTCVPYS